MDEFDDEFDQVIAISYDDVVKFVDAAMELMESVALDIKRGNQITSKTILAFSKMSVTSASMEPLLQAVDKDINKIN